MRVLITGGYGFIGSHIAERFAKEGHTIFVIDDLSTGVKDYLKVKHKFYCLNTVDEKCEYVFRNNNIDIVIHTAARFCLYVEEDKQNLDLAENTKGLAKMLQMSEKYGVKKFIYLSSTDVYGPVNINAHEKLPLKPLSLVGINCAVCESSCWESSLDAIVLRLSNVYGPRQGAHCPTDITGSIIRSMIDGKSVTIKGEQNQTTDFIYVEDVADAVYKAAVMSSNDQLLNVASGESAIPEEVAAILSKFGKQVEEHYVEQPTMQTYPAKIDNSRIKQQLGWKTKYSLEDGLVRTYEWQKTQYHVQTERSVPKSGIFTKYRPYFENGVLFLLMGALSYANLYGGIMDFWVGLDYNYVYIIIMGVMYGKRQSLPAAFFSAVIFINLMMSRGADFVTLIYQIQYLTHLATYLCVAVVIGYITDNRERIVSDKEAELSNIQERYNFLQQMHNECLDIKDQLYEQIVNSDDSLGKIHSIARELDSLRVEDIYTAAVGVITKIMKVKAVDIFTVNKENSYLRLKVRSDPKACFLPKSIKISEYQYANELLQTKDVFINKSLKAAYPVMAAPVIHDGRVIAVIQLYGMKFESLSLYYINLFRITTMLISGSLTRAYLHDQELREIKYLPETNILVFQEFEKVLSAVDKRKQLFNQEVVVIRLLEKPVDYKQIDAMISGSVRAEDYVGIKNDGHIYIMLLNITAEMVDEVRKRLQKKGIFTEVVNEDNTN